MGPCQTERSRAIPTPPVLRRRPLDLHGKAEAVLREVAFVLQMTRRVKQAIREETLRTVGGH